jgi:hypothetical protein
MGAWRRTSGDDSVFVGVDNGTSEDELGAALELFFNTTTKNHGKKRRMAVLLLTSGHQIAILR